MFKGKKTLIFWLVVLLLCTAFFASCSKSDSSSSNSSGGEVKETTAGGETHAEDTTQPQPKDANVVGKWVITQAINAEGSTLTGDELTADYVGMSYEIKEDGTVSKSDSGEVTDGTYVVIGNTVIFTLSGENTEATVDGNTMTIASEGSSMVFTMQ